MIEWSPRYKQPERADNAQGDELVIVITCHDFPNVEDARTVEHDVMMYVASRLGIQMNDDGTAGIGFQAPQVYVGVRTR